MNTQRECKHHGFTDFVLENRGSYRCRKCRAEAVINRRRALKIKGVTYLGGKCQRCGYSGNPKVFDFHHRDPTQKDIAIASCNRSWETIRLELDKCDLLCANCHRIEHDGD